MTFDSNKGYCCIHIEDIVKRLPWEEGYSTVIPISYCAYRRVFILADCPPILHKNIPLKENEVRVGFQIMFCPWCGSKFPNDLTDTWYQILQDEYGINAKMSTEQEKIPKEFKTDEWWKKRGL